MNRRSLYSTLRQAPSPQPHFLSEDIDESNDIDSVLSESSLRKLRLECYDECIYNDLPQYLVRISDMRLYSRTELLEIFRPLVDRIIGLKEARHTIASAGEAQLRKHCKDRIKRCLKYAMFSHRWGAEEPEFRDMSSKVHGRRSPPTHGAGYERLLRFCDKAREYGCEYVWSDTCCINKESSSELEEAIRSMYRWYRDAFVCIVYLAGSTSVKDFAREEWFTRGWTLQELLAPARIRMYGQDWNPICPRAEEVRGGPEFPYPNDKLSDLMLHAISEVTQIHFLNIRDFNSRSPHLMVSTKMRWAAKRKTTRIEDTAYCLLGIFDIMMSIAYGEGERAFERLLEAIAHRSGDPSFFAWAGPCSRYSLALPASPASYQTVVARPYCEHDYTLQKRGIQLKLLVIPVHVLLSESSRDCTLRPYDMTLDLHRGQFACTPDASLALNPDHAYALGVVDFQFDKDTSSAPVAMTMSALGVGQQPGPDVGRLLPGKRHFCMFMRIAHGRVGSGVELACRRIDTNGVLPLIECTSEYRAPLRTVLLEHTRFLFI